MKYKPEEINKVDVAIKLTLLFVILVVACLLLSHAPTAH